MLTPSVHVHFEIMLLLNFNHAASKLQSKIMYIYQLLGFFPFRYSSLSYKRQWLHRSYLIFEINVSTCQQTSLSIELFNVPPISTTHLAVAMTKILVLLRGCPSAMETTIKMAAMVVAAIWRNYRRQTNPGICPLRMRISSTGTDGPRKRT